MVVLISSSSDMALIGPFIFLSPKCASQQFLPGSFLKSKTQKKRFTVFNLHCNTSNQPSVKKTPPSWNKPSLLPPPNSYHTAQEPTHTCDTISSLPNVHLQTSNSYSPPYTKQQLQEAHTGRTTPLKICNRSQSHQILLHCTASCNGIDWPNLVILNFTWNKWPHLVIILWFLS